MFRMRARGLYTYLCGDVEVVHEENVTSRKVWDEERRTRVVTAGHDRFFARWGGYLADRLFKAAAARRHFPIIDWRPRRAPRPAGETLVLRRAGPDRRPTRLDRVDPPGRPGVAGRACGVRGRTRPAADAPLHPGRPRRRDAGQLRGQAGEGQVPAAAGDAQQVLAIAALAERLAQLDQLWPWRSSRRRRRSPPGRRCARPAASPARGRTRRLVQQAVRRAGVEPGIAAADSCSHRRAAPSLHVDAVDVGDLQLAARRTAAGPRRCRPPGRRRNRGPSPPSWSAAAIGFSSMRQRRACRRRTRPRRTARDR